MARETSKNVRLEVDLLDNGRIQPATDERSTLPDGRWSILVVDDDPDMRPFVRTCHRRPSTGIVCLSITTDMIGDHDNVTVTRQVLPEVGITFS